VSTRIEAADSPSPSDEKASAAGACQRRPHGSSSRRGAPCTHGCVAIAFRETLDRNKEV